MRKSPIYAIAWAAAVTIALSGMPRFISLCSDFLSVEHDSLGLKRLFTGGLLLLHGTYPLILIVAALLYPRRRAFSLTGVAGSLIACISVILCLVLYHSFVDLRYPISIQFVDLSGDNLHDLPVVVMHEIKGIAPTTSPKAIEEILLKDGLLTTDKSIREILTISAHLPGLTHVQVEVPPMGAPYYQGPLQMVSMWWRIDPRRGDRETSVSGAVNWDFANGHLNVPIPPAEAPLVLPIPDYSEADLRALTKK